MIYISPVINHCTARVDLFSISRLTEQERFVTSFSKCINAGEISKLSKIVPFLLNSSSTSNVCLLVGWLVDFLPLQVCPSPVYPALQLQEYEPTVFTQTAFTSQLWVLVLHSSRSAKITLINGRDIKQMILKWTILRTNGSNNRSSLSAQDDLSYFH